MEIRAESALEHFLEYLKTEEKKLKKNNKTIIFYKTLYNYTPTKINLGLNFFSF